MSKLYAQRDTEAQGEHFMRHLDAMRREKLFLKSDIAAELAHRDVVIERMRDAIETVMGNPDLDNRLWRILNRAITPPAIEPKGTDHD